MRLGLAFRAFFAVLFSGPTAKRIGETLSSTPKLEAKPSSSTERTGALDKGVATKNKANPRNDALTLLSALQREARFLDLACESLDEYSDAQVGAAARDVLRDTKKTLDRFFAIQPLLAESEGSRVKLPENASALRYRILGNASPTAREGTLVHPGWKATSQNLPQWTGSDEDVTVLAAAEIEIS